MHFPSLLLAAPVFAGLMDAPGGEFQVRYDPSWYPVGPYELALEDKPDACAVELLGVIPMGEPSLAMDLRAYLSDKKPGAETSEESFVGLGGREGAVIHTTRMRRLVLHQMTWAAMPLGDDTAALMALRWEGSAQSTARSPFLEIVGTALPSGILKDVPLEDLEKLYAKQVARPDDLLELRGLFYEGGALRGELFNGSDRVLNRASLEIAVRDADGRFLASRVVEVVPGPDNRAVGAGGARHFHVSLAQDGQPAPAGLGGAKVVSTEWAE